MFIQVMNITDTGHTSPDAEAPRYMRVGDVCRVFGLKRSFLYELVKQKRISSIVMRGRSATRGIRLFRPDELEHIIAESTNGACT